MGRVLGDLQSPWQLIPSESDGFNEDGLYSSEMYFKAQTIKNILCAVCAHSVQKAVPVFNVQ